MLAVGAVRASAWQQMVVSSGSALVAAPLLYVASAAVAGGATVRVVGSMTLRSVSAAAGSALVVAPSWDASASWCPLAPSLCTASSVGAVLAGTSDVASLSVAGGSSVTLGSGVHKISVTTGAGSLLADGASCFCTLGTAGRLQVANGVVKLTTSADTLLVTGQSPTPSDGVCLADARPCRWRCFHWSGGDDRQPHRVGRIRARRWILRLRRHPGRLRRTAQRVGSVSGRGGYV